MRTIHKYDHRVIVDTLLSIDCARSLTCLIMYRAGEFEQLVSLVFNPFDYNNERDARDSLFCTELLRKHEDLPTNIDKILAADQVFLAAEEACKVTNERLRRSNSFASQLMLASWKIADVLGEFNAEEWVDSSGWGPGATLGLPRRRANTYEKFHYENEATKPLWNLLKPLWSTMFPTWLVSPRIVEGNKVIQVPKNAKTNRTIAIEPSLNLYFQKGVGSMIRRRLRKFGVNLNDQTANQSYAQIGSIRSQLATVDFSSASDTISSFLVLDLLPQKWFKILDILRSPRGVYKDSLIEYEKFSSMGNGFTFELESLIFWALAKACVPRDHPLYSSISVYGDDVIIPSEFIDSYYALCAHCGFTVNVKKSYSSTYYRESCGKHYWNGSDISPIYMRRFLAPKGKPLELEAMKYHNRLVEYSSRIFSGYARDRRFCSLISFLYFKDRKIHCPIGYGDIGWVRSFEEFSPRFSRKLFSYYSTCISPISGKLEVDSHALLLTRLCEIGSDTDMSLNNSLLSVRPGCFRKNQVTFPSWPSLGCWL